MRMNVLIIYHSFLAVLVFIDRPGHMRLGIIPVSITSSMVCVAALSVYPVIRRPHISSVSLVYLSSP